MDKIQGQTFGIVSTVDRFLMVFWHQTFKSSERPMSFKLWTTDCQMIKLHKKLLRWTPHECRHSFLLAVHSTIKVYKEWFYMVLSNEGPFLQAVFTTLKVQNRHSSVSAWFRTRDLSRVRRNVITTTLQKPM